MNTLYFVMSCHMPVAISNYSQLLMLKAQNYANGVCSFSSFVKNQWKNVEKTFAITELLLQFLCHPLYVSSVHL